MKFNLKILALLLGIFTALVPLAVAGQVTGNVSTIALNYSVPESITLSLVAGTSIDMIASGLRSGPAVQVNYSLIPANHTLGILTGAYFSSSTALTGPSVVQSSQIMAEDSSVPATLGLCNQSLTLAGVVQANACFSETLVAQANVATTPVGQKAFAPSVEFASTPAVPTLPGTYSGTLNIIAWAP